MRCMRLSGCNVLQMISENLSLSRHKSVVEFSSSTDPVQAIHFSRYDNLGPSDLENRDLKIDVESAS